MNVCGLWPSAHRLVAVIANDDGILTPPISRAATLNNVRHLFDYLATAHVDTVILPERSHRLIAQALARQLRVQTIPHDLLEGVRSATTLNRQTPRHTALLLARWPFTPARAYLRERRPIPPRINQLPLF